MFAFVAVGADAKGKPKRPPFNKPEILLQWINDYRHNPEPERLAEAYRAMRDLNLLKDVESAGIYVGFLAGVIGANSDKAEKLISDMFPMPPPDQVVVVKAIAYSGLPEWKELLGKFVERMPARRIVIEKYLYGKLPVLRDLPLDNPIAVDANWGYYFATGSSEPIQRLVRTLEWSKDKNNVERLDHRQHGQVDAGAERLARPRSCSTYLKTSLPHQPEPVRKCRSGHHRVRRDLRAGADPQGRAGLHRGAEDEGLRGLHATSPGGDRRARPCLRSAALRPASWARSMPASPASSAARYRTSRSSTSPPRSNSQSRMSTADAGPSGTAAVIPLSSNLTKN